MGITRVGNVTGLDRIGIPVTVAVRPNSKSVAVSQGKGLAIDQANASALMEAAELFHGEDLTSRTRVASFRELSRSARAIDPASLCGTRTRLPERCKIPWMEAHDLLGGRSCWVPWEIVHTDYTLPSAHSGKYLLSGTNGLASGNHVVEALSSAICEVVERDAIALWHAQGVVERASLRLDLASVADQDCRALLKRYESAGVAVSVWDVTSNIGLPVFVCDIRAERSGASLGLRRFRGSGCHPNRTIALARALTEAAQTRLTYIAGIRDDLSDYEESPGQKLGAALLDALHATRPRAFGETPSFESDDLAADLQWELQQLRAAGADTVAAVDLSRPEIGIAVVRVIIPGLEWDCTHPDYVPGARAAARSMCSS